MFVTCFACAVTFIGQSYDAPGTESEPVRIIGEQGSSPWPTGGGLVDAGIKTGDTYTDGHFSISAPLYSDIGMRGTLGGTLVFMEPYSSWGEHGEVASSLGFGLRHLWNDQPVSALDDPWRSKGLLDEGIMLGVNGFLDMLSTQSHREFWQFGVGVEFATRYFELRTNRYQPMTGRQQVENDFLHYDGRQEVITSGKDPFATGNSIKQDVTFTTFDRYTESIYRRYDQGLKGWDAEAAILVPWLDKWTELWLVGGYADFQNQPFGPSSNGTGPTHGWKAGVEWRPVPLVVLNATWFEDKAFTGSGWMAGISFQIPIDPEPGNNTKGFWSKLKDAVRPRSRHLVERVIVPVRRQNSAVKMGSFRSRWK